MAIRYGRKNCKHVWRSRKDGWEEGCGAAICVKCGAFGFDVKQMYWNHFEPDFPLIAIDINSMRRITNR